MAIVDWEGFDRENQNLDIFSSSNFGISADGQGYDGYGRYASTTNGSVQRLSWFPLMSDGYFQCHLKFDTILNNIGFNIHAYRGSSSQFCVRFASSGVVVLYRGATLVASSTERYPVNAWFFVQIYFNIATAAGNCEVRINGRTFVSFTGNTADSGTGQWNGWFIQGVATPTMYLDNIVVYSTSGNAPTSWTPETRVYEDLPSGAGATTGWTPVGAAANWQCVDEQPSNSDTDYVSAAAAGLTDTYAYSGTTVPTAALVYGVAVHVTARKDDAGLNELNAVLRSGGTNYSSGTTAVLSTNYARFRRLWDQDPATAAAWTVAAANAAQAGVTRVS